MKLNEKLIRLREIHKYTQSELASYLGVGQTTYSRYESLKTYPDIFIIQKLAALYHVSIDELLSSDDNDRITIKLTIEEAKSFINLASKIKRVMDISNLDNDSKK